MRNNKSALNNGIFKSFIICIIISAATMLTLSVIFSAVAYFLDDPTGYIGIFSLMVMLISAAVSGAVNSRVGGNGGVRFSVLSALTVVLIMLLINVIICNGKVTLGAFMNYACYLGVSALSAYLGRKKNGRKRRKIKR